MYHAEEALSEITKSAHVKTVSETVASLLLVKDQVESPGKGTALL